MSGSSVVSVTSGRAIPANKWVVAVTVMFGAFMAVMDISVVNVALPYMMGSFGQALINAVVNRHATMLAYNDVSWLFGLLFLCTIPAALLIPGRAKLSGNPH